MKYENIQVAITSHCSMSCPYCSWGINKIKNPHHYSWDELQELANAIYGIDTVYIMGGEPTLHPNFVEWSPKFRELFGCKNLYLWTNGYGFKKFPEVFSYYDWVIITRYNEKIYKGCVDNSEDINFIFDWYKKKFDKYTIGNDSDGNFCSIRGSNKAKPYISLGESPHLPLLKKDDKVGKCGRVSYPSYKEGLIYPCCATYQPTAVGIAPSKEWETELENTYVPCELCVFAQ